MRMGGLANWEILGHSKCEWVSWRIGEFVFSRLGLAVTVTEVEKQSRCELWGLDNFCSRDGIWPSCRNKIGANSGDHDPFYLKWNRFC